MKKKDMKRLRMSILTKLTALIWLLSATSSEASDHFRIVDVKYGLADNFVRDITTDSEGYVWISTINGLSRFDGYHFINFQPQHWGSRSGDVVMVRETADSTLWMLTTSEELFTFSRTEQTWKMDGEERLKAMGVKGKRGNVFYVDDRGGLWVATEVGLWYQNYKGKKGKEGMKARFFALPSSGTRIKHIAARKGTTLVITTDQDIYQASANGTLKLLTHHPKPETGDRDSGAMIDSEMNLWLFHAHKPVSTLWVYSLRSDKWQQPEVLRKMDSDAMINSLAEDNCGRLWFGTSSHGIIISEKGIVHRAEGVVTAHPSLLTNSSLSHTSTAFT